jgi:hypothetical protein
MDGLSASLADVTIQPKSTWLLLFFTFQANS